ncbi:MAG: Ldh family oxidoreductase [Pirellulales bacterium]|nr:Ldh family oxidoreductase [Pirellulales bacterium]
MKIPAKTLKLFAIELLKAGGLGSDEARAVATSLVDANLRGHDSHGVMRIPYYLDQVAKGEISPAARLSVVRESAATLVADGNWGFGQVLAHELTERLVAKARSVGVGVGTMIHSGHVGRLGEWCELATEFGMLAMMMVNTHGATRRVAPPGGKSPRLGTNPLAFAVPHGDEPLVLDFGTSATAEGKVRVKRIAGQSCPEGWLLDSEGRPTVEPSSLYGDPPGSIRPMGGDQPFKGFGLGVMVEIFSGALSGGLCAREVPETQLGNCVFMLVADPGHFGGSEHFAHEVGGLLTFIRGCPRIDGVDRITLAGDPERAVLAERTRSGVPFDDGNWQQLVDLAGRLKVAAPAGA